VEVLRDVSLDASAGAFVSIIGPSGCGKSTILRVLAGLLRPGSGTATVDGVSTVARPGLVAFMPQKDLLLPWRRVLGNATLGATVAGVDAAEARRSALELMPLFGLTGFERAWPAQLSGGMRQRLALLRTWLIPAGTVLLDEPFGALDAITRREMHGWLQGVLSPGAGVQGPGTGIPSPESRVPSPGPRVGARTVLFVTHDIDEALVLGDVVYVMSPRPGRMVARVESPFPRPRSASIVVEPEFVRLKAEILHVMEAKGSC
jgi:ABC-type nitrate/sulfonate/bicarbonate transport system ATPase subunit